MTKDELIKALKEHLLVMENWAMDLPDEFLDGTLETRHRFVEDLTRSRDLRFTEPVEYDTNYSK